MHHHQQIAGDDARCLNIALFTTVIALFLRRIAITRPTTHLGDGIRTYSYTYEPTYEIRVVVPYKSLARQVILN
jgi:hypothetical protein